MTTPDTKPGAYYVSVVRGDGDWRPLLGPFVNDHAKALALVDKARAKAEDMDPRAAWAWARLGAIDDPRQNPARYSEEPATP